MTCKPSLISGILPCLAVFSYIGKENSKSGDLSEISAFFGLCRPEAHFESDMGTEELAHMEMISTIVHQLTRNLSMEEIENSGFGPYYIDHTTGIWPQAAAGIPFNSCEFQCKGDPITDLHEDLAAEQKARSTYDNILRVVRDIPEIADPIKFLRAREVVHFQRFGEALRSVQEQLESKNFYAFNPSFDMPCMETCKDCK